METILLSRNDLYKGSLILVNHSLPMHFQAEVLMNISNTSSSPMYLEKIVCTLRMGKVTLWRSMHGS